MYLFGIIIIILDGIIVYLMPNSFNELNYLYPLLSLVLIVIIYDYNTNYLKKAFIFGFIYDLLYSDIFFYNTLLFLLLAKINKKIFKYLQVNTFNKVLVLIINIIIYDLINFVIIYFSKYNLVSFNDLIYKILHSLLLNILAVFVLNFILRKLRTWHRI